MDQQLKQKNQLKQISEIIMNWVERDEEKIVQFFSSLVKCDTPSPPGDTREAMAMVQSYLDIEGLPYRQVNAKDTMPNIISSVQMPSEGRHLMFNGHLDVLPAGDEPGWTDDPWSGKIVNGRVWGRGTSDMKAGVTAMLFAYTYLSQLRDQLKGKLSLTIVSDEETGYGRERKLYVRADRKRNGSRLRPQRRTLWNGCDFVRLEGLHAVFCTSGDTGSYIRVS